MKKFLLIIFCLFVFSASQAQKGDFHLDEVYKISKDGTIDLRSSDAKVYITGTNRIDAHVKIDRTITSKGIVFGEDDFRVDVMETGKNLVLREVSKSSHVGIVGYYSESYKIVIDVPEGVSLKIQGDDGDYFIKNIAGSISMDIDDADAELTNCTGDRFSFNIDDGDVRMDRGRGKLEVRADDADIEIKNAQFMAIYADMDDGDFIVQTSLADYGEYEIKTEDGSIILDITNGGGEFNLRHDDARVITEGEFRVLEKTENRTILTLGNGKARVNVNSDDGRIKLTAQ